MMSNKLRVQRRKNRILLNRIAAIFLVLISLVPLWLENDATALCLFSFFALGMWFQDPGL